MFDIGWSEMAVIMLVALVVIGPKDLPRLARNLGQWVAKGRAMAREFQRSLEDMAREAELDDVKREIEKVGRTNIGKTIERTIDPTGDLGRAFNPSSNGKTKASAAAPNGEAKEPVTAKPEPIAKPEATPKAEAAEATAKAKPAAKPKAAAKPRTSAKPKATAGKPKPASSESGEAKSMAEPR